MSNRLNYRCPQSGSADEIDICAFVSIRLTAGGAEIAEEDLWAEAGWHGLSPRRAGESFLSPVALVTGPAPPFSSPFPALPPGSVDGPLKPKRFCSLLRQRALPVRAETARRRGGKAGRLRPRGSGDRTRPERRRDAQ